MINTLRVLCVGPHEIPLLGVRGGRGPHDSEMMELLAGEDGILRKSHLGSHASECLGERRCLVSPSPKTPAHTQKRPLTAPTAPTFRPGAGFTKQRSRYRYSGRSPASRPIFRPFLSFLSCFWSRVRLPTSFLVAQRRELIRQQKRICTLSCVAESRALLVLGGLCLHRVSGLGSQMHATSSSIIVGFS